jgi:hypothetical protein
MRQPVNAVRVETVFGVTTVIEIVQNTVKLPIAADMTEVVTHVLMVGMEQCATIRVI